MNTLIGHSGFVGGNLLRQGKFESCFNSTNIDMVGDVDSGIAVCAAAPGSMFEANRYPDKDQANIASLQRSLAKVKAKQFVLISSIAVLEDFAAGHDESTSKFQAELAYGRHRRELEVFAKGHFDRCLIVRLPALFGPGLRKNFLYDLLNPAPTMLSHEGYIEMLNALPAFRDIAKEIYAWQQERGLHLIDRCVLDRHPEKLKFEDALVEAGLSAAKFTHPRSTFQFYNMANLWSDISMAIENRLDVLHLCPEPIRAGDVHILTTGREMPDAGARLHHEDMRTLNAGLFQQSSHYTAPRDIVIKDVADFLAREAGQ